MGKYVIFIVVFLISFTINVSVSRGETKKNVETDDMDVYYEKTKVFRDWDKKGSAISKSETGLLSLYPEQLIKKKEIESQQVTEDVKVRVIHNAIEGNVSLKNPQDISRTPVADSILNPSVKPLKVTETPQVAEQEKKTFIYGGDFEQNCYFNRDNCSFFIYKEVEQYNKKLTPKKYLVDTKEFPIDF